MKYSKIEWTHHTFNPWIGCTKVSAACDHCYAENLMDHRLGRVQWGPHGERKRTSAANWKQPLSWNRAAQKAGDRHRVFCASLADVFDNQVPQEWRRDLFDLIDATPSLDWLLLTKRPQNIRRMMPAVNSDPVRPNVWLGTTVENQVEAERRIPVLLEIPARIHFLSCEPLLGPVDIPLLSRIDWIICGGESGANARPMNPNWARSLRDQCVDKQIPFFFKQWGEWCPFIGGFGREHIFDDGQAMFWRGRAIAGRLLDGFVWNQAPTCVW